MAEHHYISFGTGEKVLICFHGYEQTSAIFYQLNEAWQKRYTIYAFDLLFHGESIFPKERQPTESLQKQEIQAYFKDFLDKKNIDYFELMGYSFGARICLYLTHLFKHRVEGMYLYAPDGFRKLPLQNFAEQNRLGNRLFLSFVRKPSWFHASIRFLRHSKFIRQRLHDFVLRKTASLQQREQLYSSWLAYKHMHLHKQEINGLLRNVPNVFLIFGKYDAVIPVENIKPYDTSKCTVLQLDKGHDLFNEEALTVLQKQLNF